jgi:hypothetical protein
MKDWTRIRHGDDMDALVHGGVDEDDAGVRVDALANERRVVLLEGVVADDVRFRYEHAAEAVAGERKFRRRRGEPMDLTRFRRSENEVIRVRGMSEIECNSIGYNEHRRRVPWAGAQAVTFTAKR